MTPERIKAIKKDEKKWTVSSNKKVDGTRVVHYTLGEGLSTDASVRSNFDDSVSVLQSENTGCVEESVPNFFDKRCALRYLQL